MGFISAGSLIQSFISKTGNSRLFFCDIKRLIGASKEGVNLKRILAVGLLAALVYSAAFSDTFTDNFSNTNYLDAGGSTITSTTTSSTSGIDTSNQMISLPFQPFTNLGTSIATYLQRSGLTTYTSINAICYGAQPYGSSSGYWLIGGTHATTVGASTVKLLRFDGTNFLQLQDDVSGQQPEGANFDIIKILFANNFFYLLNSNGCFKYAHLSSGLSLERLTDLNHNFSNTPPPSNLFNTGAFSGSRLVFGSSNGAMNVTDTNTAALTDLSTTYVTGTPFWLYNTEAVRAIASNGSYFLIGGGSGATGTGRLWKFDPSQTGTAAWTNLCANSGSDLNFGASWVYSIAWNGSYFLIGGSNGQLKKFDGATSTFTDLSTAVSTATGGNFGTQTIYSLLWTGAEWIIGGAGGKLCRYDGNGTTAANFKNISWLLDPTWLAFDVTSSGLGNNYMLFGSSNGDIDGSSGIYAAPSEMKVQSKQINVGSGRVYKATLTAIDSRPAGTSIIYYLSADNGVTWQQVSSGVEAALASTGNVLKWKAVFSGSTATPTLSQISIAYTATDMSVIPAGVGGTVFTPFSAATGAANVSIVAPNGSSDVDVRYDITRDAAPPVSSALPTSAIIAFDVTAVNGANGSSISTFNNPPTLVISYNNSSPTYVDSTSPSILMLSAPTSLALAFWNGLNWVPVSSTVTTAGNVINVSARVTHFSKYAIVAASPNSLVVKAQPNPFTPLSSNPLFNRLTVSFPNSGGNSVVFKVWDVNGVLLRTINDGGSTQVIWDGKDYSGKYAETGLYIYEVKVGGTQAGKGTFAVAR